MVTSSWLCWFRSFFHSKGRTYRKVSPRRRFDLEYLETRLAPAQTFIWTGADAGSSTLWSDDRNWQGGLHPQGLVSSLDDLVFPAGVTGNSLKSKDDIVGGTF